MKKVIIPLAITFAVLILIMYGSIAPFQGMEKLPGIEIKPERTNTDFVIYEDPVVGSINTHKNGDVLAISVKNRGNVPIHFLPGYIKIFAKINKKWISVLNGMSYPEIERVLPPTKEYPPGMDELMVPSIQNMVRPTVIRVFLVGQREDTGEQAGAYVDIELVP